MEGGATTEDDRKPAAMIYNNKKRPPPSPQDLICGASSVAAAAAYHPTTNPPPHKKKTKISNVQVQAFGPSSSSSYTHHYSPLAVAAAPASRSSSTTSTSAVTTTTTTMRVSPDPTAPPPPPGHHKMTKNTDPCTFIPCAFGLLTTNDSSSSSSAAARVDQAYNNNLASIGGGGRQQLFSSSPTILPPPPPPPPPLVYQHQQHQQHQQIDDDIDQDIANFFCLNKEAEVDTDAETAMRMEECLEKEGSDLFLDEAIRFVEMVRDAVNGVLQEQQDRYGGGGGLIAENPNNNNNTSDGTTTTATTTTTTMLQLMEAEVVHNNKKQLRVVRGEQLPVPKLVSPDTMVFHTQRLLEIQEIFRLAGKPALCDVAYHYTQGQYMDEIRVNGLLTKIERDAAGIVTKYNGAALGHGIYTARDPIQFKGGRYGDTGLFVARVRGVETEFTTTRHNNNNADKHYGNNQGESSDTVMSSRRSLQGCSVLKQSDQCLCLVEFPAAMIGQEIICVKGRAMGNSEANSNNNEMPTISVSGDDVIKALHVEIQKCIDKFFNGGQETVIPKLFPQVASPPRAAGAGSQYHPPPAAGSGSASAAAAAERDMKKQKEKFLMFTRVLTKFLEQKDPPLHRKVKSIVKDCVIRNRDKEPGYESVTASMKIQLRKVVNDNYWKKAEAYLDHFLKAKAKECSQSAKLLSSTTGGGGSGSSGTGAANVKSGGASGSAPSTSMQRHHRHALKKPKRPLSAYNFFFQLEHDRIIKGDGKDRDTIVKYTAEDIAGIALIQQKKAKENNPKEKLSHLNGNSFSNLARTIGNNWKKLDDPSKAIFEQKVSIDKERYRKELAEWNKQQQTTQSGAKPKVSPSTHAQSPSLQFCVRYKAPETLHHASDLDRFLDQVTGHSSCSAKYDDCPICLRSLQTTQKVSKLKACHHSFCHSCIVSSLQHSRSCPICRKVIDTPQGKMPSGSMTVRRTQMRCDGCSQSLRIDYSLDVGTQKMYHVNPGVPYRSCRRIAYLPDNEKGRALLMRLKYAFQCGLTFTIGTSLTTGRPNVITWSSIHHKTTLSGGVHGFPDPNYFQNANEELDALGVPKADDL